MTGSPEFGPAATPPTFSATEAWSHSEVAGLVETVLRGLPSGATLILEVGDHEPFVVEPLESSPSPLSASPSTCWTVSSV